jgi:hypothetical protein
MQSVEERKSAVEERGKGKGRGEGERQADIREEKTVNHCCLE